MPNTLAGDPCLCRCTLWRHVGICTGEATVTLTYAGGAHGEQTYRACEHCANEIMQRARKKYTFKE